MRGAAGKGSETGPRDDVEKRVRGKAFPGGVPWRRCSLEEVLLAKGGMVRNCVAVESAVEDT